MVSLPDPIRIMVPEALDGLSALEVARRLGGLDEAALALLLARGGLWVDGRREPNAARVLAAGSLVQLRTPPGGQYRDAEIAAADLLYEDDWLLVLNKRPGWYVSATPWDTWGHVGAAAARYLAQRDGAAPPLHLAHQLDRDTSGCLLLSKHPAANAPLHRAFAGHLARKRYLALCQGWPAEQRLRVETGIGRGPGGGFFVYPLEAVGPRPERPPILAAVTEIALLARLHDAALVEALPISGRTHQIRLHMAHLGHPLLGDARYGGPLEIQGRAIAHHMLHAQRLELPHPASGTLIAFEAPTPASWNALLQVLTLD